MKTVCPVTTMRPQVGNQCEFTGYPKALHCGDMMQPNSMHVCALRERERERDGDRERENVQVFVSYFFASSSADKTVNQDKASPTKTTVVVAAGQGQKANTVGEG